MNTVEISLIINLEDLLQATDSPMQKAIIQEVLDHASTNDEVRSFLSDVIQHGCISGMVNSLIYYCDTHQFYDTHYEEIETLRIAYEENAGQPIIIKNDLKNFLSWFAFEETAYQLLEALEIPF